MSGSRRTNRVLFPEDSKHSHADSWFSPGGDSVADDWFSQGSDSGSCTTKSTVQSRVTTAPSVSLDCDEILEDVQDAVYEAIAETDYQAHLNMRRQNRSVFEEENIFAELASFVEKLIYQQGNVCPPASPEKAQQALFAHKEDMVALEKALCSKSLSRRALICHFDNKALVRMNNHFGRNQGRLMAAARVFNKQLANYDMESLSRFLKQNGMNTSEFSERDFNQLRNDFPVMHVIVLFKLLKEYPLITMRFILDDLKQYHGDIYDYYASAKTTLFGVTLNKKAYEPYRLDAELRDIMSFSTKITVEEMDDNAMEIDFKK